MDLETQRKKAERLLQLHDRKHILVLPNAWDAASARIFELAGFNAVATTSAGVAYTSGYPDGERIPREDMLTIVRWIARCVEVPVTADIEAGFADSPEGVAATMRALVEAGAVGANLEDSVQGELRLYEISEAVERIRAAREAADSSGVPLVLNARTDVFLRGMGEKSDRFDHAVVRLNAYRKAGADCLYPIGFFDADTIARLAREVDGPINIMGFAGGPSVAELERLGAARVSTASGMCRVAMAATSRAASALMRDGSFDIFSDLMSHQEADRMFDARA